MKIYESGWLHKEHKYWCAPGSYRVVVCVDGMRRRFNIPRGTKYIQLVAYTNPGRDRIKVEACWTRDSLSEWACSTALRLDGNRRTEIVEETCLTAINLIRSTPKRAIYVEVEYQ